MTAPTVCRAVYMTSILSRLTPASLNGPGSTVLPDQAEDTSTFSVRLCRNPVSHYVKVVVRYVISTSYDLVGLVSARRVLNSGLVLIETPRLSVD